MVNYDPEFILAAFELGYSQKDIYPIEIQQIQRQSYEIIKKMPINEKDFYIYKKLKIYEARRQRIIKQIQRKYQQNSKKKQNNKNLPLKLRQIYSEHQKRIAKNKRYQQTLTRGLQSSGKCRKKQQIANTIDFDRKSPQQNNSLRGLKLRSQQSSRSSKSQRSQASSKSNRSKHSQMSSNLSDSKLRLSQVRQKQKNIQEYKKKMLRQKLKRDELKFLKAEQNNLHKSYKAKARSQISRKIINENRKQIQQIKKFQLKNHYEGFKFKLFKNEYNRDRNNIKSFSSEKKKTDQSRGSYINFIVQKQKEQNQNKKKQFRYDEKLEIIDNRMISMNQQKNKVISEFNNQKQAKSFMAKQINRTNLSQKYKRNQQTILWEQKKQQNAEQKRLESKQQKRMHLLSQNIRRQIAFKNHKSVQLGEKNKIKNQEAKLNQKLKNVQQIEKFKKILRDKQKEKFGKVFIDFDQYYAPKPFGKNILTTNILGNKYATLNLKQKNSNNSVIRNSFTSKSNYRKTIINKNFT